MKVVLSPNPYRDKGLKTAQHAQGILEKAGIETTFCLPFRLESGRVDLPKQIRFSTLEEAMPGADVMICFGGDGTILHAARNSIEYNVPILGVNLGSVGFMAELEQGELQELTKLAQGTYRIEERMMLSVRVLRDGKEIFRDIALNDAVITKGAVARVIELSVHSNDAQISAFSGDGLILATPTGSTAYSMSAGGPIVEPTAENILVTPICPHVLYARPFVLDDNRIVTAKLGKLSRKAAYLSVDGGKAVKLSEGDIVEVQLAQEKTRLIHLTKRSFYEIVSQKLGRGI